MKSDGDVIAVVFLQLVGLVVHTQHAAEVAAAQSGFAQIFQPLLLARFGVMPSGTTLAASKCQWNKAFPSMSWRQGWLV